MENYFGIYVAIVRSSHSHCISGEWKVASKFEEVFLVHNIQKRRVVRRKWLYGGSMNNVWKSWFGWLEICEFKNQSKIGIEVNKKHLGNLETSHALLLPSEEFRALIKVMKNKNHFFYVPLH